MSSSGLSENTADIASSIDHNVYVHTNVRHKYVSISTYPPSLGQVQTGIRKVHVGWMDE